jgi:hypothetical protein
VKTAQHLLATLAAVIVCLIPLPAQAETFEETRAKAEQGDADAQNNLGVICANDNGVEKYEADNVGKSKQLVLDSRRCLSAFQCYHFAMHAEDLELSTELFLVGYESGRRFLNGVAQGKLLPDDQKEIGFIFSLIGGGPSHDFILGRLLEMLGKDTDDAFKDISIDAWGMVAERELRKRNAELIVDSFKPDLSEGEGKDEAWNRYVKILQEEKARIKRDNEAEKKPK